MKARTKDHPHHFGKLKNDVARRPRAQASLQSESCMHSDFVGFWNYFACKRRTC